MGGFRREVTSLCPHKRRRVESAYLRMFAPSKVPSFFSRAFGRKVPTRQILSLPALL